jgi:hypothetical protein
MATCQCVTTAREMGTVATVVNRSVFRGDSLVFSDAVWQDVTTKFMFTVPVGALPPPNSVPTNLDGARVVFTAKSYVTEPDNIAVWQLDTGVLGGVTLADNTASGAFYVKGDPIRSRGFADGPVDLVYDIQVMTQDGIITTVEAGTLTVIPDVSRLIA